ncbi:hypothetical protein QYE76_009832 [Lolium multiflorum]|uniref:Transposon protein, putative, CACTA, En/Spm sub-class n=1 Tax=Lolium multiflorum TaxID=4521 RepID=A0AAD8TW37_LOLMU|nr:hypothetical protein QYE76_009832 [Lolium multiflorum]
MVTAGERGEDGEAPLLSAGTVAGRRLAGATPEEHRANQERVACRREMGIEDRERRVSASMVLSMSSARISRYKIDAKEDMIRNNRRQIRCPCRSCKLERWINPDSGQLEEHLLRRGFMQDNQARPAPSNGAHEDHVERDDYHHEEDYHHADGDYHHEQEVGGEDHHEEEDAGGEHHHDEEEDSGATPLISALRDSHVQDLLLQETSNDRVVARERAKLSQMEKDGMTPIFPGCRPQDTRLHVTLDYLQMKTQNKWTDSSFSKNLKFWHDRLPEGNTLPSSTEEAKKVVCPLDLPHEKYHACINDCVIYRCEYKDRTTCPVCGHGRYKVGNKKVPRKVVWYFPITPRLQRYFVDPKEAKLMQWHAERQKPEEDPEMGYMLTHPSDAGQWQALDIAFPRFGGDARNIRLGMSTDGLNPFGNQSSTHSTWPVFVWPYNLPPWLCTKQRYIHLSILIQGPKQPGVDMHLYLGLLKEELDTLWKTPPRTWDAYTRTYFDMRAALITTVTDYPGYAYVSAQVGHGFNGCVKCMDDTPHLQLPRDPGSSKTVYPEKSKDGPKARYDLKHFGIRKDLQAPDTDDDDDDDEQTEGTQRLRKRAKKNAVQLPAACFTTSPEELEQFFRKSIGVRQLKMLQDEIVVILCELEIYFPPAFCDICVHLLLHVVEDIKQLGPTFLHNMMPFERQNGVMKGYVRNRARPDASMAKGFLTYECISFCQNYLSTEDDEDHVGLPPRTHLGRLAGVGHREGYRSVHVGIENRRDDFDRAHRVALQHLKLTEPFVQEHKSMVEQNYIDMGRPRKMGDVTKKHNSSFTRWFKQTQLVEAQRNTPSTEDEKLIYTLSQGPAQNLRTYQGYDINGYRFYTEEKDRNSENQNSGVTMLSYADDETNVKERFFGRIEEIWELNYCGETVPMFRVRWAKKVEKEGRYFTTMVIPDAKSKNASAKNEPWVLGSQVDQCFFITDPSRPSRVVVRRGKRSIIGMQGDANEEDLDKNGDPKMEEEFDRHFDMPTTSKFLPRQEPTLAHCSRNHRQAPPPSATAAEEEEEGDRHAATEQDPQARAAAAQIKEEEDRHAAAEEEDRHAAAEEEEEDNAATTTTLNRRRSVRCSRLCMQINMSGNTSKPRSQNEEAREANKDFWEGYEQHPRKAAAESPDDEEEGRDAASEEEVRDTAADTGDDDDTWDDAAQTGEETTGEENAANRTEGDSGGNPQEGKKKRTARRPRRDRRPQVLANVTDAVTVVSESGLPMEPSWVAKGYGMQLGCIVRETVPILTQDLRSKENEAIVQSLLQKLHQRYTFPEPFNKKVDSLALTKMSTALSSWKNRLKRKIEAGESWERISSRDPSLSLEDFNAFKSYLESDAVKKWTAWGKKMRDLNLGTHHCGSGGYRGKQPTWDKEDAEMVRLGKENPWHKIQDEQARNFVRSRYYLDWKTGQFITDHEVVRDFEKYLDEELTKAGPSSQGSTEPWDTPFNRAMNKYKERELDKPPTSGGRVSGFGTSMKLSEYYGSDAKTRKLERRSSAKDKSEVQELKKKVETLEKLVAEKPVENTEMMKKLLDEKIRQIIPPGLMEGLAAWNAGGQVGPIHVPSISGSNSSFHVSPTVPLHPTPASGLHQTPPQLQPPPQLQLVASTPPTAALVSTVAEIDAIKEDEPCILLQTVEPGGKLVEVASGLVMPSRVMHGARLAEDVAKVKFGGGLPSGKKSTGATSPIIRPKIASADDTLKETAVAAPTTLKEPAVAAATRKEPTIAVTTRRHKQLLGALPQRPSTRRTVRQATASQPPPPKVQDMAPLDGNDVEDDDDIDAYINTGACSQDMYMPPMDEQAFRTHGDQLSRPPTVTKQRLVFTGLSQDTPPEAGNPAQVKPATVFSPNTLRKTIIGEPPKSTPATSEAPPAPEAPPSAPQAPPVGQAKKGRKRGGKKGASSSQPAPKRIRADDMVPPTPDGLPRCHEAGKPILPPDMEHLASGPMLPLQHCIQYQESVLLKEKDPNYPVFSVKVPSDQHFVNEDPADIFFIAFEDVFNLFHSKRLDYNLLQDGSSTRTKAVRYLESFMLMNKEKNTILLPVFPEDKYCTLIILCPKWSLAQYFDSSNTTTKKDYRRIRGVLDEAILGYSKNGGTFDKKGEFVRPDTKKLGFKHVIDFPCIKQPAGSIKEAFYVLHHLKGFVEDAEMMSLPPSKRDPIKMSGEINDDDLREDFHRLQMTYYVVFEGRVPGVYEEWEECKKQVHKFSGNCYKGYPTRHEAVAKWRAHQAKKSKMKTFLVLSLLLTIVAAVLYFILV